MPLFGVPFLNRLSIVVCEQGATATVLRHALERAPSDDLGLHQVTVLVSGFFCL